MCGTPVPSMAIEVLPAEKVSWMPVSMVVLANEHDHDCPLGVHVPLAYFRSPSARTSLERKYEMWGLPALSTARDTPDPASPEDSTTNTCQLLLLFLRPYLRSPFRVSR